MLIPDVFCVARINDKNKEQYGATVYEKLSRITDVIKHDCKVVFQNNSQSVEPTYYISFNPATVKFEDGVLYISNFDIIQNEKDDRLREIYWFERRMNK